MKKHLDLGRCFVVGNGLDISVWSDPRVPNISGFKPAPLLPDQARLDFKVSDFIDPSTGQRNRPLIWATFSHQHADAILKIHLSPNPRSDELVWVPDKAGVFTIKSMYRELVHLKVVPTSPVDSSWWKKLWRLKVHERLKTALWKLLWDVIPTKCSVAAGIGVRAEDRGGCVLCGVAEESTKHLLFECLVSRIVWSPSPWSLDIRQFAVNPISEWLKILIDIPPFCPPFLVKTIIFSRFLR